MTTTFHLLKNMSLFSLVGLKGKAITGNICSCSPVGNITYGPLATEMRLGPHDLIRDAIADGEPGLRHGALKVEGFASLGSRLLARRLCAWMWRADFGDLGVLSFVGRLGPPKWWVSVLASFQHKPRRVLSKKDRACAFLF